MSTATEKLAKELGELLKQRRWKLVTAESCTAGGLAYAVTSIAGSSDWFERGYVTYSNASKMELLDVTSTTLNSFGAVSEHTAREMAEGALRHSHAQISLAITGIAGPDGGTSEKPVGTVWFACARANQETIAFTHLFSGDRKTIRELSIQKAIETLLRSFRS